MYRHIIRNFNKCNPSPMLLSNLKLATMASGKDCALIEDGAVVIEDDEIGWVGSMDDLPEAYNSLECLDFEGRLATPGLIDCHTHVVFGGDRAREFEMRLEGASYEDIARSGGGIVSTVNSTRNASEEELLSGALERVDALISEGVTTIEIKSGYGLDNDTELKMLRVARRIEKVRNISVVTSFLGAHAVPDSHEGNADGYIKDVCLPALEAAHREGLIDAVDGFCEGIAFSLDQIRIVFDKAAELGLPVKLHAEQLSNLGGTILAAEYNALSADHVEYADEAAVRAMAKSGMVAVLLPGAFYTLRETQVPPIDLFRKHKVPMAVATDCNPGSSPLASILIAMNMACTLFRMTPAETMAGVTRLSAKALGLEDRGELRSGKRADLCIWDVRHPSELSYRIGFNALHQRICGGVL